jgi:AraC-like DNA-binding protein
MKETKKEDGFDDEQYYIIPIELKEQCQETPGFNSLTIERMGYFPEARYHYCDYYSPHDLILIYCTGGFGYYVIDNKEKHILTSGQIAVLPPLMHRLYASSDTDPWSIFFVNFVGKGITDRAVPSYPISISNSYGEWIKELFLQCFYILRMPYQIEEYVYVCQMAGTILSIIPCASKWSSGQFSVNGSIAVERAIAYIKKNLHKKINLEQIAQAASFSPSRLAHLFKQYTGYAPIEYFLRTKVQTAARDVFFSSSPISEIAAIYGIEDPYYFSRLFKKIMGVSPQQYRKNQDHLSLQRYFTEDMIT